MALMKFCFLSLQDIGVTKRGLENILQIKIPLICLVTDTKAKTLLRLSLGRTFLPRQFYLWLNYRNETSFDIADELCYTKKNTTSRNQESVM